MKTQVCLVDDDFSIEKPRWVVNLSDQSTVFMDDYRPGQPEWNSWKRLNFYCKENNLYITHMHLQFWSNVQNILPNNSDGYFFRHAGWWLFEYYHEYFVVGTLNNGILRVNKWAVPELIAEPEVLRNPLEADISLIKKNDDVLILPFDEVQGKKSDQDTLLDYIQTQVGG